jgi:hypothetical protein
MPAKAAVVKVAKSEIYDQLEALLKHYSPPFTICPPGKVGTKRTYGLWSLKEVEIQGRRYPALYFASVIEQKDYVGFYYMPIYMSPKVKANVAPRLLKMLRGKCCFHLKTVDSELFGDVKALLDLGLEHFTKSVWL